MNLSNYYITLNLIKKKFPIFLKISLLTLSICTIYYFIKTPSYTSKTTFYSTYKEKQDTTSLLNPLGSLIGINGGTLDFSISDYIKSEKMLNQIINKKYLIDGQKISLVQLWGSNFEQRTFNPLTLMLKFNKSLNFNSSISTEEKLTFITKEELKDKISFTENRISSLYSISVTIDKYPQLSKDILNEIYSSIIAYTNEIENSKASEKIDFINGRIREVSLDLQNAEREKLEFLEQNKVANSPALVLRIDRIQRKIDLHSDVYTNLANQLEIAKINQKDSTSSIFLLDEAKVPLEKDGDSLLKFLVKITILLLFSFIFWSFYKSSRLYNS